MITATFFKHADYYSQIDLSGHAGYAECGNDIVCAAVTSSVEMVINTITDVLHIQAEIQILSDGHIAVFIPDDAQEASWPILEGLFMHLKLLSQQYPHNIRVLCKNDK